MREDLVLDDVDDSPKSNHLEECTSNVDDDKPCVPLEMECSDNNNGMWFPFAVELIYSIMFLCYSLSMTMSAFYNLF